MPRTARRTHPLGRLQARHARPGRLPQGTRSRRRGARPTHAGADAMTVGYLDLPSGISGDMFLGCLVDAGWPIEQLRAALTKLKLPTSDWSVDASEIRKGSAPLRATLLNVRVSEPVTKKHQFVMTQHS